MQKIFGYGEDALTFWALTEQIDFILKRLNDNSSPSDCLFLYRPSFSRGGDASFGEFDAILATPHSIYLIESKWYNKKTKNEIIGLKNNQDCRHRIFRWYFKRWNKEQFQNNWQSFQTEYEKEFQEEFDSCKKKIATAKQKLSKNIEFVLNLLDNKSKNISDVLLLFCNENSTETPNPPAGFKLVVLNHPNKGGHFEMHCLSEDKK